MTITVPFTKMHGAGNDYIYINVTETPLENPQELAIKWSASHTGIGSDGLVLIGKSDIADFSMHIFNADGSEAMMCGNATRCIGKYVYDKGLTTKTELTLETLSGIKVLKLHVANNKVESVTVDMGIGKVVSTEVDVPELGMQGVAVDMGNPHLVLYINSLSDITLEDIGARLEHHPFFPDRVNVEFAEVIGKDSVRMRVWERGSGITMACGTGACATAVAGLQLGKVGRTSTIEMDGGALTITLQDDGRVFMTGPATLVYEGEIEIQ